MVNINVCLNRRLGNVNQNIFGHFCEHAFNCIKGGIFDPNNNLSNSFGIRNDVIEALKDVKVPILRYPGGNFVSNYHWEDGIGPKEKRKRVFEYAWQTEEDNLFGTIEFIELCKQANAEPYICCNMGSGTMEEAMHWVEFCNGTGDTYYANMRRKYGYSEPFNVKYWGLGNEVYGIWQMGNMNAEDYCKKALQFANAMKSVDNSIELIACGLETVPEWNYEVVKSLKDTISYVSLHHYSIGWGRFNKDDYLQMMSVSEYIDEQTSLLKSTIESAAGSKYSKIKIAWDEWNMFGWKIDNVDEDSSYTLENAIVTASILNKFIKNCNTVTLANYSTFVNITGAVGVKKDNIVLRPQYFVFKLFAEKTGNELLDIYTESERFSVRMPNPCNPVELVDRQIAFIDTEATFDISKNTIYISVINKHNDTDFECNINISNYLSKMFVTKYTIFNDSLQAYNSLDHCDVSIIEEQIGFTANKFDVKIRKHSINIIQIQLYP